MTPPPSRRQQKIQQHESVAVSALREALDMLERHNYEGAAIFIKRAQDHVNLARSESRER